MMRTAFPAPATLAHLPRRPLLGLRRVSRRPAPDLARAQRPGDELGHGCLGGFKHRGRLGIVYSTHAYGCEWDDDRRNSRVRCEDNTTVAVNPAVYALTACAAVRPTSRAGRSRPRRRPRTSPTARW